MIRRRRALVVGLCIAVVAVAAFLPGTSALDYALFELPWVLLPDQAPTAFHAVPARASEQPDSLLSLALERGPPPSSLS